MAAQSDCMVLISNISETYSGECKKGLADGEGEATGVDSYKGSFKKGLPDGEGTYIWASGAIYQGQWKKGLRDGYGTCTFSSENKESTQIGYWREDQYVGAELVAPYLTTYKLGVTRVSFFKQRADDSYVEYKFSRSGNTSFNIEGLMMQGSSGTENTTTAFTGFREASFPFEGKVQFKAPNMLNSATNNYELRFRINQPGAWTVTIFY